MERSQGANGRGLTQEKDVPWTTDAPVMRISFRVVADNILGCSGWQRRPLNCQKVEGSLDDEKVAE